MKSGVNSDFLPDLQFQSEIPDSISLAICIPACNELSLIPVIQSLKSCIPQKGTLVSIAINASDSADNSVKNTNETAFLELKKFIQKDIPWFAIDLCLYNQLPDKKSGVGLARRLAMDRACTHLKSESSSGILCGLDADCTVKNNYCTELFQFFKMNPEIYAASIYFEHPEPEDRKLNSAIYLYEMHLRYLKNALQWCGYPWYYHTVGSSMAVRARIYLENGGMNTRKAGEDFYFLHKFMPMGFGEITGTTVFPEARYSDRVPFGTGRSMLEMRNNSAEKQSYNFEIFKELKLFFLHISENKSLKIKELETEINPVLFEFLWNQGIPKAWEEAVKNTSNEKLALRRFYKWFSGFWIIRCLHFLRDNLYPDVEVEKAVNDFLSELDIPNVKPLTVLRLLDQKKEIPQ
ncbi:MAG: hypothetical protein KG003_15715 [Bacteroidetes bacterium]|nr:hypothetical protein [Bacteroidota bacterium]